MHSWERSLDELVRARMSHLVACAMMLSGSREHAQDLVQDALVSVHSSRARFPEALSAEGYVRRAIASRFIDSTRRLSRDKERYRSLRVVTPDEVAGADHQVELRTDLARALQSLTPRERACVVLRHLEQLSTRETAHSLGISEGSVKRYLADAMAKLHDLLGVTEPAEYADVVSTAERSRRRRRRVERDRRTHRRAERVKPQRVGNRIGITRTLAEHHAGPRPRFGD